MLKVFQTEILNPKNFIVTLELVPGKYSMGRSVDAVKGIAKDSFSDGRIAAVSVTDNPGGNPSLSPDVLGRDIFKVGMDVILHFTSRDMNRVGMESRALQLAMIAVFSMWVFSVLSRNALSIPEMASAAAVGMECVRCTLKINVSGSGRISDWPTIKKQEKWPAHVFPPEDGNSTGQIHGSIFISGATIRVLISGRISRTNPFYPEPRKIHRSSSIASSGAFNGADDPLPF